MSANGRFYYQSFKNRHRPQRFRILQYFIFEFFCSKISKTLIDNIFLNSVELNTFTWQFNLANIGPSSTILNSNEFLSQNFN